MRRARIQAEGVGYYHAMSRIIERRQILGDVEKQRFSQTYNTREGRCGPLWEQRFKSVLVEGSPDALLTIAVYLDLNPVRAGLVADPKDYRYSGYREAMGGGKAARAGLRRLLQVTDSAGRVSWGQAYRAYRQPPRCF